MSKALPALLMSVSVLTGCASGTTPTGDQLRGNLPVLKKCPPLPALLRPTPAEMLNNHTAVTAEYHRCRLEVDSYLKWLDNLK